MHLARNLHCSTEHWRTLPNLFSEKSELLYLQDTIVIYDALYIFKLIPQNFTLEM